MLGAAASVARQGDPDLTAREIAQRVRELKSKSGSTAQRGTGTTSLSFSVKFIVLLLFTDLL